MDVYEVDVGGYKTTLRLNVADAKRLGLYREPAQPEQAPPAEPEQQPEKPDTPDKGKPDGAAKPETRPGRKNASAPNKARTADDVGNK